MGRGNSNFLSILLNVNNNIATFLNLRYLSQYWNYALNLSELYHPLSSTGRFLKCFLHRFICTNEIKGITNGFYYRNSNTGLAWFIMSRKKKNISLYAWCNKVFVTVWGKNCHFKTYLEYFSSSRIFQQ